jgi:hypothetical protein
MQKVVVSTVAMVAIGMSGGTALAWSEQNCNNTCHEQMPGQEVVCRAKFNCAQYRGKKHVVGVQAERAAAASWAKGHPSQATSLPR